MDIIDILVDYRVISVLLGILFSLLYWCSSKNSNYWDKKGIPCEKYFPIIGVSPADIFKKNKENLEVERYKKYGRIYGFYEGKNPAITVCEPELLKRILVKDFQYFSARRISPTGNPIFDKMLIALHGEDWKRIRAIISPTFSTGKIKRVMGIFQECANTSVQNFKKAFIKGETIDVLKIFGSFTMDVIASSAFSTKLDSHNAPENEFVKRAKAAFTLKRSFALIFFLVMPNIMKKLGISPFDIDNMNFFKKITQDIIEERRKTGQVRNDFLQLLMDSAKEVSKEDPLDEKSEDIIANYGDESMDHPVFKHVSSKHLTMDELIPQCIIFFLAGYHTTTTTLGLLTYYMALHPHLQEKLFQEIKDTLEETNGIITYESIQKMKYLDNVISETFRMHSPLIKLDRTADADYKLGDTGITIPKGMVVNVPIYAMHKDPEFFPDPEKFNPDRFTPEEREKQIPYTYLPFGAGPRNCVAMRFALLELKICLVQVFSHFEAKTCAETKIPVEFGRGSALLQPKEIFLKMELRNDCLLNN